MNVALGRRPSYRSFRLHHTRFMWSTGWPWDRGSRAGHQRSATEDSDWIIAKHIDAAHVRTDATGTAIVSWVPREKLHYVDVDIVPLDSDWKIDETDQKQNSAGVTTIHVRRERAVKGRLIMPEGADAEGILITGFGFGPTNVGDIPYARAQKTARSHFGFRQSMAMCWGSPT